MALTHVSTPAEAARFLRAHGCQALCADSRRLQTGQGFIAWPGYRRDARSFVPTALAMGAPACLVEAEDVDLHGFDDGRIAALAGLKRTAGEVAAAFLEHPSQSLDVVATTGTNGKTSTAWWTAQALAALGRRSGVVGTLGIGEPGADMHGTGLTTPDPVTLQAAFAAFRDQGFAACAIEASSTGLVEHRLGGTQIGVALFTNFTRDHLDYHGTMEAYWAAKRALFDWPGLRAAAINVDDEQGARLAADLQARGLPVWTVSIAGPARLRAGGLRYVGGGLVFEVQEDGGERVAVHSTLVGDYNASNLLVVMGGLRALGFALADIAAVVPRLLPVPGRLQPVPARTGQPAVLVDYAHTPDALEKVLAALRPMAASRGGQLWCVFGCGGNRDATKRPMMGAIASRLADRVVLTSDNPRNESPTFILSQILAGVVGHDEVAVIEDRAEAIAHAVQRAGAADVILLAGKGHEPYQEVAGVQRPFLDADEAARALSRRAPGAAA